MRSKVDSEGHIEGLHKNGLQFFRFLLVGALNTVVGYLLFVLLCRLGLKTSLALAGTYALGVLFNFISTGKLVFGTSNPKFLVRFLLVYAAIYAINLGLITILMHYGLEKLVAQAILVPFMAIMSFGAFKLFAFKEA